MSTWWASVVKAVVGHSRACVAIRSSFVEMEVELGVSFICLSFDSVNPAPPSLHGVPWIGSPASSGTTERSDFPDVAALLAFALLGGSTRPLASWQRPGPPRFLGNLPVHALLFDPGGTLASGHSGDARLCNATVVPSTSHRVSAPALSFISGL